MSLYIKTTKDKGEFTLEWRQFFSVTGHKSGVKSKIQKRFVAINKDLDYFFLKKSKEKQPKKKRNNIHYSVKKTKQ